MAQASPLTLRIIALVLILTTSTFAEAPPPPPPGIPPIQLDLPPVPPAKRIKAPHVDAQTKTKQDPAIKALSEYLGRSETAPNLNVAGVPRCSWISDLIKHHGNSLPSGLYDWAHTLARYGMITTAITPLSRAPEPTGFSHQFRVLITVGEDPSQLGAISFKNKLFVGLTVDLNTLTVTKTEFASLHKPGTHFDFGAQASPDENRPADKKNAADFSDTLKNVCLGCHQNQGLIFGENPWSNTTSNLGVLIVFAKSLFEKHKDLYTARYPKEMERFNQLLTQAGTKPRDEEDNRGRTLLRTLAIELQHVHILDSTGRDTGIPIFLDDTATLGEADLSDGHAPPAADYKREFRGAVEFDVLADKSNSVAAKTALLAVIAGHYRKSTVQAQMKMAVLDAFSRTLPFKAFSDLKALFKNPDFRQQYLREVGSIPAFQADGNLRDLDPVTKTSNGLFDENPPSTDPLVPGNPEKLLAEGDKNATGREKIPEKDSPRDLSSRTEPNFQTRSPEQGIAGFGLVDISGSGVEFRYPLLPSSIPGSIDFTVPEIQFLSEKAKDRRLKYGLTDDLYRKRSLAMEAFFKANSEALRAKKEGRPIPSPALEQARRELDDVNKDVATRTEALQKEWDAFFEKEPLKSLYDSGAPIDNRKFMHAYLQTLGDPQSLELAEKFDDEPCSSVGAPKPDPALSKESPKILREGLGCAACHAPKAEVGNPFQVNSPTGIDPEKMSDWQTWHQKNPREAEEWLDESISQLQSQTMPPSKRPFTIPNIEQRRKALLEEYLQLKKEWSAPPIRELKINP